jgi:hypothetical protein
MIIVKTSSKVIQQKTWSDVIYLNVAQMMINAREICITAEQAGRFFLSINI